MTRKRVTPAREESLYPQRGAVYLTSRERETDDTFSVEVRKVPSFCDLSVYYEFTEREREGLAEENHDLWHGIPSVEHVIARGLS